jgi:chromosomal replication initiator protein
MNPWEKILDLLQKSVSPQSYSTWLKPSRFSHVEDSALFVRVPNETFRRWYEQNFGDLLQGALQALELGVSRIEILCDLDKPRKETGSQARFDFDSTLAQLNPRYTFETFVVGSSNQFAHAAAIAVARNPSKAYNSSTAAWEWEKPT